MVFIGKIRQLLIAGVNALGCSSHPHSDFKIPVEIKL